jgi:hypothetical protein
MSLISYRPGGGFGVVGSAKGTGIVGPQGPAGPGIAPLYGSLISNTTQNATTTNPVAITYSSSTIGTIVTAGGTYPNSQIRIPTTGVYKVLLSAQCDSSSGQHYLEIFPAINGSSIPDSNTRIRLSSGIESCLTIEYFLSINANDILEFYMIGDSTNSRILAITGGTGTPVIPNTPSVILTIMRIG